MIETIFNASEYAQLATLFDPAVGYPGFRPRVRENPNGDGKTDEDKRYLHVALKYDPPKWALRFLERAHFHACRVAEALRVPAEFYPNVADATLRVLHYPVGVGSHPHTDPDLFTLSCYRSTPADLVLGPGRDRNTLGVSASLAPGLHIGEIGELVGLGPATRHQVLPRPYEQRSIVYFAIPSHAAELANGPYVNGQNQTVGEWLDERLQKRGRVYG
jgi:hypothetical protein